MGFPSFSEQAHDFVTLYRPEGGTAEKLDLVRGQFHNLIDNIGPLVPNGPDASKAARDLHTACQSVIFAIVHNQE